jgi:hypothetical protein
MSRGKMKFISLLEILHYKHDCDGKGRKCHYQDANNGKESNEISQDVSE